ncbi:MAG: hypothetical protein LC750_18110 [Actinobacteria bacterium]|nr:hypothetical protein [Actinomycetota bacterium]
MDDNRPDPDAPQGSWVRITQRFTSVKSVLIRGSGSRMIDELSRPATVREEFAQRIDDRLDPYMVLLAILWLAAWTLEPLARPGSGFAMVFNVAEIAIWILFAIEFVARVVIAESTFTYLKKRWWELAILALPGLRFMRVLRVFRVARVGSGTVSFVHATRSAENRLASRITTLAVLTTIIILVSGRLMFDFGGTSDYVHSLHDSTLAAIGGEPFRAGTGFADFLEVILVAYHGIVVAALAGAIGAFFLKKRDSEQPAAAEQKDQ